MGKKTEFSDDELSRYSRHILLPQIDIGGQLAFANARVLVVGLGGLGSPVAQYLAASGVGQLDLVDHDQVELSNLQRQVIHSQATLGLDKVESAARAIAQLNPNCCVRSVNYTLAGDDLAEAVDKVDVVVDCTDNFSSRMAINHQCLAQRTPLVSGAAIRMEGQVTVFNFRQSSSPCYQCLYDLAGDDSNLTCSENGVLAPVVGVIGATQAVEVLKLLANIGEPLTGRLQLYDAMSGKWREFKLRRDPACKVCGTGQ